MGVLDWAVHCVITTRARYIETLYKFFAQVSLFSLLLHPPPLSLLVSPQFTVVPSPTSIQERRVLSLPCAGYGHPDPDILWFKDDQQLINPLLDPGTQSLQLYNTTPGDTGAYTCLARNFAGVIQYSVAVTIEPTTGQVT